MKVTDNEITPSRTTAKIDLEADVSRETKEEIGDYLIEQILLKVAARTSPVTGDKFDALSKDYRRKKTEDGLPGVPNLEESGDMLDSLDYRITDEGLELGIFGDAAPRADGHNNLSGESRLPTRRFIPAEGEGFVGGIEKEVARIIADATAVDPGDAEDLLDTVESSAELYDVLRGAFSLSSRAELRLAVLRSDEWTGTLSKMELLKWL